MVGYSFKKLIFLVGPDNVHIVLSTRLKTQTVSMATRSSNGSCDDTLTLPVIYQLLRRQDLLRLHHILSPLKYYLEYCIFLVYHV